MQVSMLTTVDNPWDPFDQFDEWFVWDVQHGYNSSGLLARIASVGYEETTSDQHWAINQAIDEIVRENVSGMFKKVTREIPDPPEPTVESE